MTTVLEFQNLTKSFGTNRGVSELSAKIDEGSVVGFLGPNGAGKSTTINMLVGFTKPTSGSATIFDKDVTKESLQIRKDIGFLTSDTSLDGGLTGWQQLEYFSYIHGNYNKPYIRDLANRLNADLTRKIKTLSRGNKQKIALIAALMHQPKLLLLDEPTSGLDPLMQSEFNKIILEHKAAGRTTFISSHVLSEVQELCDRMIFIREGKIIADKTKEELLESSPKHVAVKTKEASLVSTLKKLEGVGAVVETAEGLEFAFGGSTPNLISVLAGQSFDDLIISKNDLEDSFMGYYGTEGSKDS
jgi:ABC-2 type transport system ATP-binding protein